METNRNIMFPARAVNGKHGKAVRQAPEILPLTIVYYVNKMSSKNFNARKKCALPRGRARVHLVSRSRGPAVYQNQLLVCRFSSTSSMADSISAASARVRVWDRLALLGSTDTASIFTTDW